jgi:hypothetical protein
MNEGAKRSIATTIELLLTHDPENTDLCFICNKIDQFPIENFKGKIFHIHKSEYKGIRKIVNLFINLIKNPFIPLTYKSFSETKIKNQLAKIIHDHDYTLIILNGPHVALALPHHHAPYILREENIEYELWDSKAQITTFPLSLFYRFQSLLIKKIESKLIQNSLRTWVISKRDQLTIKELTNQSDLFPICFNFESPLPFTTKKTVKVLAFANWDWAPNREGLTWFLNHVWIFAQENSSLELVIAGFGNLASFNFSKFKNISVVGEVESAKSIFNECHLLIAPLFYGGGLKVKTIEATLYGRTILGTPEAFVGTSLIHHKDVFIATSSSDWVKILNQLEISQLEKMGVNAFETNRLDFDKKQVFRRILDSL